MTITRMSSLERTARRFGLAVGAVIMALPAAPASAYLNSNACYSYVSAQTCWIGDGYHSLTEVDNDLLSGAHSNNVCAKAYIDGGGGAVRTGSGCNSGSTYPLPDHRYSCLSGSTPMATGYGYWADGSGSQISMLISDAAGTEHIHC